MSKSWRGSFARSVPRKEIIADFGCGELAAYYGRTDAGADVVMTATSTTNHTDDLLQEFHTRQRRGWRSKEDRHGFLVAG
jgi:hypothetical protein